MMLKAVMMTTCCTLLHFRYSQLSLFWWFQLPSIWCLFCIILMFCPQLSCCLALLRWSVLFVCCWRRVKLWSEEYEELWSDGEHGQGEVSSGASTVSPSVEVRAGDQSIHWQCWVSQCGQGSVRWGAPLTGGASPVSPVQVWHSAQHHMLHPPVLTSPHPPPFIICGVTLRPI